MISRDDSTLRIEVPMVIANARELLARGQEYLTASASPSRLDLSAVTEADSSALTVLFAWMRRAQARGCQLSIVQPPASLLSLAELYGVSDLLPLA
ncbi:MAG TPA: STAS domain-containing protein [Azospira sp.]|nr:STAS domain-containing protein [Azospira sp.]